MKKRLQEKHLASRCKAIRFFVSAKAQVYYLCGDQHHIFPIDLHHVFNFLVLRWWKLVLNQILFVCS